MWERELKKIAFQPSVCLCVSRVLESRSEIYEKILNCKSPVLYQRKFTYSKSRQKRTEKENIEHLSLGFFTTWGKSVLVEWKCLFCCGFFSREGAVLTHASSLLHGYRDWELFYWWMMDNWVSWKCCRNCSWYLGIKVYENTWFLLNWNSISGLVLIWIFVVFRIFLDLFCFICVEFQGFCKKTSFSSWYYMTGGSIFY